MGSYCTAERREKITKYLLGIEEASVAELVKMTSASEATIRRDLLELEKSGALIRTFGGARAVEESSLVQRTFAERSQVMRAEKLEIAARAVQLIEPGMTIVIDSGTTCWHLLGLLEAKAPLHIITSALAVIETLGGVNGIDINLIGGHFRLENLDFVGPLTNYENFHADIAFLGCDSLLPDKGAFSLDVQTATISKSIAGCADIRVLLCDHSKINQRCCYSILPQSLIDYVIVDSGIDPKILKQMQKDHYQVICDSAK